MTPNEKWFKAFVEKNGRQPSQAEYEAYAFKRDDGNVFYVGDWDQNHDLSEDPETSTAVADLVGNVMK